MSPGSGEPLAQLFDKAITNLYNVQAQNRFTQSPIDINQGPVSGSYNPITDRIAINTSHLDPFWRENQRVMTHEGIHSLLAHSGFLPPLTNQPISPEAQQLNSKVLNMFTKDRSFGYPAAEIPAYIATQDFRPLEDIKFSEARKWFENFKDTLSPSTRKMLDRMVSNLEQSKKNKKPDESTRLK